ncbi:MAG: long-chain fatty acid--CoA ligase [Proteobacteria bacterium]|nr:long-chain fatty acid--CoA ligase [Pseudomonadota bacterium]MBU1738162.1 long-chain fatty acid--CoA ligase [Pseudomonadota bacterium]
MKSSPHETIPAMFTEQVARFGDRTAVLYKPADQYRTISWNELARMVREVACGLVGLGVKVGDRVAIMSYNRPEWLVADLAIMSAGGVTVPIYHTSSRKEADYILDKAGVDVAFVARSEKAEMLTTCDAAIKNIISLDPVGIGSAGSCALDYDILRLKGREILENGGSEELAARKAAIGPDQCATIIFTSGTTGSPKGVMLSHRNILANAQAALEAQPVGPDDTFLSFLPLSHSFERTAGQFLMLVSGAVTAYAQSIRVVADNIQEVRPTIMLGVPRFYEKLYARIMDGVNSAPRLRQKIFHWAMATGRQMLEVAGGGGAGVFLRLKHRLAERLVFSKLKERLGGRLKFFVAGGAPLAQEIAEFFLAAGVQVLEGYGLTEYSPVIAVNRLGKIRPGTVGNPLPGCEVKIFADGEIGVRGPSVMLGYYHDPEATAGVIIDGWLMTGDLGELEDNYLKIVDRKKDIIVTSGGKNISPQYIENLIITDEYVSQIVLYGDRKNYLTALVVPDYELFAARVPVAGLNGLSPEKLAVHPEMHSFLMGRIMKKTAGLAPYETVRKILVLPEPLTEEKGELTPTMKIKRKAVLRKFQPRLDALYLEDEERAPRSRWP